MTSFITMRLTVTPLTCMRLTCMRLGTTPPKNQYDWPPCDTLIRSSFLNWKHFFSYLQNKLSYAMCRSTVLLSVCLVRVPCIGVCAKFEDVFKIGPYCSSAVKWEIIIENQLKDSGFHPQSGKPFKIKKAVSLKGPLFKFFRKKWNCKIKN